MEPFHPRVATLLAELEAVAGGPRLSTAALERWATELLEDEARPRIGDQLVALSARFAQEGGWLAAQQLMTLAMLLVDERSLHAGLEAGGLPEAQTRKLIDTAKGEAGALGKGLAPPGRGAGVGRKD